MLCSLIELDQKPSKTAYKRNFFYIVVTLQNVPNFLYSYFVGNFRDVFVYFQGYRILRKINYEDNFQFTLRDIGYLPVYFQGYGMW